jgi:signal transduction histidine kinase
LRPGVLDDLGVVAAIEWQAHDFQKRSGIRCRFQSNVEDIDLDPGRSTALFRIFQETLTNIARHAEATAVNIKLTRKDAELILEVRDNGRGISAGELSGTGSLGLLGMRERAHSLGGEVQIEGRQGKGTTVIARIPLG